MGIFGKGKGGGLMNVIRCDEQEYLVWKWRPAGQDANTTSRENAIRWGSSLRVKDGEVAVFVYKQKAGAMQEFIEGPFDEILKTANLPIISKIVGMAYGGESPFQADVYFINLAGIIQVKFAIPYFDVQDPRFPDMSVPVATGGTISFKIDDYKAFIKVNRLINFTLDDFKNQIKDAVVRRVKGNITNVLYAINLPLVQIERNIEGIGDAIKEKLKVDLEDFGVTLRRFDLSRIEPDKESENWLKLQQVTAEFSMRSTATNQNIAIDTANAQAQANIQNIHDMQAINTQNMSETLRIQREEMQRAQRAQTEQAAYAQKLQSEQANIGAFSVGRQADVLAAAANNLGQMGNMNMGSGNGGFNPAGMMTGMAVGGAVGQQMAQMMAQMNNGQMDGGAAPTPPPAPAAPTPPPMPGQLSTTPDYYLAENGQQSGPFSVAQLKQLVDAGKMTAQSMVWKNGMPQWAQAAQLSELQVLFMPAGSTAAPGMPPVPPPPAGMPPMP